MRRLNRCGAASAVLVLLFSSLSAAEESAVRPNVVFILADDLGFGDVKCYGGDRCQTNTPSFDRLALEGTRFTNAHSIGSVCVPSRMGIMTGRYAWRFGAPGPGGPWGFLGTRLPLGQPTVATMVKVAGYHTGYVGKWHLGTLMQTKDGRPQNTENVDYTKPLTVGPPQYGFDDSFILPGSLDMYPYAYVRNNQWVGEVTAQKGWSAFNRIGPAATDFADVEVLDTFCGEAERFISKRASAAKRGHPFFLYLALTSPHTPLSPSAEFEGKSQLGVYGDFVEETDHCVGRVLAALEKHGLVKNTLVIATSDHGAAPYAGRNRKATDGQLKELEKEGHYASGGYRGYKFCVYEGGFRVPYVVRWPGHVQAGATCERLVGLHDLVATLADLMGVKLAEGQAPDSISILPLLKNPAATSPRQSIILQSTRAMAIQTNDWKLAFCPGSGCLERWLIPVGHEPSWKAAIDSYGRKVRDRKELFGPEFVQLFHLTDDPAETTDVANLHPKKIRELRMLFESQVKSGRSTPGELLKNDRNNIKAFPAVPAFVWERQP